MHIDIYVVISNEKKYKCVILTPKRRGRCYSAAFTIEEQSYTLVAVGGSLRCFFSFLLISYEATVFQLSFALRYPLHHNCLEEVERLKSYLLRS